MLLLANGSFWNLLNFIMQTKKKKKIEILRAPIMDLELYHALETWSSPFFRTSWVALPTMALGQLLFSVVPTMPLSVKWWGYGFPISIVNILIWLGVGGGGGWLVEVHCLQVKQLVIRISRPKV